PLSAPLSPRDALPILMKAVSARGEVVLEADEPAALRAGPPRMSLRRLWRFKWGVAATAIILTIVGSAVWAPWISPWDPLSVDIRHRLGPPAWLDGGTRAAVGGRAPGGRARPS